MSFGLLNVWMLFGLAALAIPPLIHLLNRRRFDVVDWGAMQFLQVSETTRRRLLIEEILLMLLRMGLIAVLVLALAWPQLTAPALSAVAGRPNRDVVLLIDASSSMGLADATGKTAHDRAKEWAAEYLATLVPGDAVAVLHAGQQVTPILEELTHDLDRVRDAVTKLPPPRGGCDWPRAVQEAQRLLAARSRRTQREIVLLSDGQRHGWADREALFRWEMLAAQLNAGDGASSGRRPRVVAVNVAPPRGTEPPNYSLAPLTAPRSVAWAGQRLAFKTAIHVGGGRAYEPPHRVRLEVDGKFVAHLPPPRGERVKKAQVPLTFAHRFAEPGSHVVSVVLEPDPPAAERPAGYAAKDALPGDNRQDVAVEVLGSLPVLLIDGDTRLSPQSSTYFLERALTLASDPKRPPVVLARAVPAKDFAVDSLQRDLDPARPGSRPRVLVLADVPRLTRAQQDAVGRFVAGGGGLLVIAGERVEPEKDFYDRELFRNGTGWLPARLDRVAGDRGKPELAAAADVRRFHHPALDLFREEPNCTLGKAGFPRWWKVSVPVKSGAVPVALLTTDDPLLVEKRHGSGRVLLCTVPLDRSWGATLPSVWEYPVLAHELVYYLADARAAEHNLQPGQPLRYALPPGASVRLPTLCLLVPPEGPPRLFPSGLRPGNKDELPERVLWAPVEGPSRSLRVERAPLDQAGMRGPGVYRVEAANATLGADGEWRLQFLDGASACYVVQPDPRESDLTPATEKDRQQVAALVPMQYVSEWPGAVPPSAETTAAQDVWWWFFLGVILLLCGEVWMTRRMVRGRAA